MGLTLHYRLTAPANCTARRAAALVRRLHARASRWAAAGRIERVLDVSAERDDLDRFGSAWRTRPQPDDPETSVGIQIRPEAGWIFPIELGADCEPLWLGLCRYPPTVAIDGRNRATRLGARWQFAHSIKTQYASLHGWAHFVRCHVGAVELLGEWRGLGGHVKITDEGAYWPGRQLATLRQRLDQMNGLVAALAGAVKDATDDDGHAPVQSPIFAHPHFERLEAEGAARTGASLVEAMRIIARSTPR